MSGYDFSHMKVLVADDSRHIRSLVNTFLNGFGVADVIQAADAASAFEEITDKDPDLVITDWNMPPSSGLDLVDQIRNHPDSPNPYVPIIMLTGFTELYRVRMARDTGVSTFLAKPVSAASLYKRLCAMVDDKRAFVRVGRFFGPDRRMARRSADFAGPERRRA